MKGKKQMKKMISILLCAVMVLSLAACQAAEPAQTEEVATTAAAATAAATQAATTAAATQAAETEAAPSEEEYLPLVKPGDDPVTLTVGIMQKADVESYEDNDFTKFIEEKTGVNLDFVYFSSDSKEAKQQIALMISSGEKLPDILWKMSALGGSAANEYGEDGYFLNVLPLIEKYGHFFNDALENRVTVEADKKNILTYGIDPVNGELYGMPEYQYTLSLDTITNHPMINGAWLEKLGLSYPTTMAELHDVLAAFRDQDPNGNGQNDEITLVGSSFNRGRICEWLMNPYIYVNDNYFFNVDNNEVWIPYDKDEYRQGLVELNKWYKEGLISPLTFTLSTNEEMIPLMSPADGTSIAGVISGHPTLIIDTGAENCFEYEWLGALKDETGKGGYQPYNTQKLYYETFITEDCENPEMAFKVIDFLYSEEAFMAMRYGVEGRDWQYTTVDGKEYDPVDGKRYFETMDGSAFSAQNSKNYHVLGSSIINYTRNKNISSLANEEDMDWADTSIDWAKRKSNWYYQKLTAPALEAQTDSRKKEDVIFTLVYNADEQEVVSEVATPLIDYIKEARALFITGVMDPSSDADWQSYLDALKNQGIEDYLKAAQSAYKRMNG